jgi:hypothetical protein
MAWNTKPTGTHLFGGKKNKNLRFKYFFNNNKIFKLK